MKQYEKHENQQNIKAIAIGCLNCVLSVPNTCIAFKHMKLIAFFSNQLQNIVRHQRHFSGLGGLFNAIFTLFIYHISEVHLISRSLPLTLRV